MEEIYNNTGNSLENKIYLKLKEYFELNKFLTLENLDKFLVFLGLKNIWFDEKEQNELWELIRSKSLDKNNIDYNTIYNVLNEYFSQNNNEEIDTFLNKLNKNKETLYHIKFINEIFFSQNALSKKENKKINFEQINEIIKNKYKFINLSDEILKEYLDCLLNNKNGKKEINYRIISDKMNYINKKIDTKIAGSDLNEIININKMLEDNLNGKPSIEQIIVKLTFFDNRIIDCLEGISIMNANKNFILLMKKYIEKYLLNPRKFLYDEIKLKDLESNDSQKLILPKSKISLRSSFSKNSFSSKSSSKGRAHTLIIKEKNKENFFKVNSESLINKNSKTKNIFINEIPRIPTASSIDYPLDLLGTDNLNNNKIIEEENYLNSKIHEENDEYIYDNIIKSKYTHNNNIKESDLNFFKGTNDLNSRKDSVLANGNEIIINQDNNFDFIYLSKSHRIKKLFHNNNDKINNNMFYSELISAYSSNGKKQKCELIISSKYFYFLKPQTTHRFFMIKVTSLKSISIHISNCNLLFLSFEGRIDIIIESLNRMKILIFIKHLFNKLKLENKLFINYPNNFNCCFIKKDGKYECIDNLFEITPNFDGAIKIGYLQLLKESIFGNYHIEKFVVLCDIGVIYFNINSNYKFPDGIIPIIGSKIKIIKSEYKEKNGYRNYIQILTGKNEKYLFSSFQIKEISDWENELLRFQNLYYNKMKEINQNYDMKQEIII